MKSKYTNPELQQGDMLYCDPLGVGVVLDVQLDIPTRDEKKLLSKLGKDELQTINRVKIHWNGGAEISATTSLHCVEAMQWGKEGLIIARQKRD